MSKIALLFPGQGSQRVAMGKELAIQFEVARRTFEEADAALGDKLSTICWEGPEDQLTLTANTQPAILTNSIAVLRTLQAEKGLTFDVVAGHSLGDGSALVAAGADHSPSSPGTRWVNGPRWSRPARSTSPTRCGSRARAAASCRRRCRQGRARWRPSWA
jgi:hypothetical protein